MYKKTKNFEMFDGTYFLSHYIPANRGSQDTISKGLLKFKDGNTNYLKIWSNYAAFTLIKLKLKPHIIVRAISSSETVPIIDKPLDKVGENLAYETGSAYTPKALYKIKEHSPLKFQGGSGARKKELNGIYRFDKSQITSQLPIILIIDDIITTGSTAKEINRAIRTEYKQCKVYFLALGQTVSKSVNISNVDNSKSLDILDVLSKNKKQGYSKLLQSSSVKKPVTKSKTSVKKNPALSNSGKPWSKQDDRTLINLMDMGSMDIKTIANRFGRTPRAIKKRLEHIDYKPIPTKKDDVVDPIDKRLNQYKPWTRKDDSDLKTLMDCGEEIKSIANHFGRTPNAIRSRLGKINYSLDTDEVYSTK